MFDGQTYKQHDHGNTCMQYDPQKKLVRVNFSVVLWFFTGCFFVYVLCLRSDRQSGTMICESCVLHHTYQSIKLIWLLTRLYNVSSALLPLPRAIQTDRQPCFVSGALAVNYSSLCHCMALWAMLYTVSQKTCQLWNGIAQNCRGRFCWHLAEIFKIL